MSQITCYKCKEKPAEYGHANGKAIYHYCEDCHNPDSLARIIELETENIISELGK